MAHRQKLGVLFLWGFFLFVFRLVLVLHIMTDLSSISQHLTTLASHIILE